MQVVGLVGGRGRLKSEKKYEGKGIPLLESLSLKRIILEMLKVCSERNSKRQESRKGL